MMPSFAPFSGALPLLLFLAKATLLLVAALVATLPLRRSTAGARHLVWLAALVGVLALPLLSRIGALRIGILPSVPVNSSLLVRSSSELDAPIAPLIIATDSRDATTTVVVPSAPAPALAPAYELGTTTFALTTLQLLALLWAGVALSLLAWLVGGALSVRRIVEEARELTSPDWTTPLCEVADRLDLDVPPRLVMSDRIEMAFACRALAPTIVLPAAAEDWTDDRRRAVLLHELAHVKRHDLIGHTLGRVACALYWFHPLVWTAAKNLRAESERACDDLVLSCGARPSEYAQHLLDMVTSVRHHGAPVMALPMARKKEFEGRMLAILDPAIPRTPPSRLRAGLLVATLGVVSLTIAAVAPASAKTPTELPPATPLVEITAPELAEIANALPAQIEMADPALAPEQGQAADSGRVGMLIRILGSDGDASVRRTAAWGLHDVQSSDARAALVKALRGDADDKVREMSAWALADHTSDDAVAALGDATRDKSAHVRTTAVWALGSIGAERELGSVESLIVDSDAQVRQLAIWAVAQMDVKKAPPSLVNALTDNSSQVREIAAWALGTIGDASRADAIVSAFQTETSSQVRLAEMWAMRSMGRTSQAVVDAALRSSDPELRRHAVSTLAGGEGAWPWPWPWPWPRPYP
ncbi:MAG: putative rane protein [Gemmatimonadetes bacterium]|nr:putative rane protein [Gemmatimonadota bacterium]